MKHIYLTLYILIIFRSLLHGQQEELLFHEGFEDGYRPDGWTEEVVISPNEYWRYRNGGHNPGDPNNEVPPGDVDLGRNPDMAYEGNYNAFFQKSSTNNETTKLITPPLNLEFALKPELRFWHAQMTWIWSGQSNYDVLRIYYKNSEEGDWILLTQFLDPLEEWTEQIIPLPNPTSEYYIAFEAQTRRGFGVAVDEVRVYETEIIDRYVGSVEITQASTDYVVGGTYNNEIFRLNARVFGNTGELKLNSLAIHSLNTDDNNIPGNGVKLFSTLSGQFYDVTQIGASSSFEGGVAVFENIDHAFNSGNNWFWITVDIDSKAGHGNRIDAMFNAGSIGIGGEFFPDADVDPPGYRTVLEPVFYDNFEDDTGWSLTGEFEIAVPTGGGGTFGNPNPVAAYNGTRVLGTDLTGQGAKHYEYEKGLYDSIDFYYAKSPQLDLTFYKDVMLRFRRWLNVHVFDGAFIEVSTDGGISWDPVWQNNAHITDNIWQQRSFDISSLADRHGEVFIRFGLGPTGTTYNFTGWNIDNFIIAGEYITRDMGVVEWVGPFGDCGMSDQEVVQVRVENFAAIPTEDPVPVAYSIDGGATWTEEEITETIPVGGSIIYTFSTPADFSQPGLYQVMAKTNYPGDQEQDNDGITTEVLSIPVYTLPYHEDFEGDEVIYWRPGGDNGSWSHGQPSGTVINSAAEGTMAWVTGLEGSYNGEESSFIEGPCFDLSGNLNPVFEMNAWWHTPDPADHAAVMVSIDGRETWQLLGTEGEGDEYSWNWYNSPQGWSGESNGWKTVRNHMPALAGQGDVCFRVIFNSAPGEKDHEGFAFDGVRLYNVPPDVGVTAIHNLQDGCAYTLPVEIEVGIMNFGLETIHAGIEMVVGFDINGENKFIETFLLQEDLDAGAGMNYIFDNHADLSAEGEYILEAYTMLEGDIDFYNEGITNDTAIFYLELTPIPIVDLGMDIYTVLPDTVLLDAWAEIDGYDFTWHDGSTGRYYDVQEEGEYTVTVTDWTGCFAISSVNVVRLIADIGVTELVSPGSECSLADEEPVTVRIENFGTDTLTTGDQFMVHLTLDGGDPVTETVILADTLYPGNSMEYTFAEVFDFSVPGNYALQVYTGLENDNDETNDLLIAEFEVFGFPEVDLGDDVVINSWQYELDAGEGFVSYLWHDGSDQQKFTVGEMGQTNASVVITDSNNCQATDEVSVTLNVMDIAIDSVLSPVTRCGAPEMSEIHVRLKNTGTIPLEASTSLFLGYTVNEGGENNEELVLDSNLDPDDVIEFVFSSTQILEEDNWYHFTIFLQMDGDMRSSNDTVDVSVGIFEPPLIDLGPDIMVQVPEYIVDAGEGFEAYLWHDASTEQTWVANQMGINNVSVTVTDHNNCTAYDAKQVLILISDIGVSDIEITGTACSGRPENLRVGVSNYGNTNISSTSTIYVAYSIDGGDPVTERLILSSALGAGSVVYHDFEQKATFPGAGDYTIEAWTIYASDPINDNDSSALTLSVFPSPEPDIGNGQQEIVTWSSLMLDAGDGYAGYLWQDGSSSQTFTVDQPVDDWFSVTVTDNNTCTGSDSVFVSFPEADIAVISVGGPASDCSSDLPETVVMEIKNMGESPVPAGEEIEFHYRINQGTAIHESYELEDDLAPGATLSYEFSAKAQLGGPGEYEILVWFDYYRDGNSQNNSAVYNATIYGFPSVNLADGADTLFASLPVTLDAGSGYASYSWQDGSNKQTFDVPEFGEYSVVVVDTHGCEGAGTVIVESPLSVSVLPEVNYTLRVYPNPASERLFINIDTEQVEDRLAVELINLGGVTIYQNEKRLTDRFEDEIAVDILPKGLYIIKITAGSETGTRTILVN